jgi:flagellar protein FlaI
MALPFDTVNNADSHEGGQARCPLHGLLPEPLRERADQAPHLMEYLHMVPIGEVGVPEFYPEVSRKLGDIDNPNLIYPVGEQLFVHIYPDPEDARDYYIPVEPTLIGGMGPLISRVERRLLEYVDALSQAETEEAKAQVLVTAVEENCRVRGNGHKNGGNGKRGLFGLFRKPAEEEEELIPVTARQLAALKYVIVRDKIGMGVLEPMIQDPHIEDISCSGIGSLFVEHKVFKGLKSTVTFENFEELDEFVLRLSEKVGRPVTFRNPIVDASLPDGSRINIVYGGDVSKRGSNFTIRKFASTPMSALDLVEVKGIDYTLAAYLSLMVGEGCNLFVSGETASGKTTLLNAFSIFIPAHAKIVSIEDTPELQVPHPNWTREVVRGSMSEETSSVTMFNLLKAALRQRPNCIIIGEIRGEEGAVAFQAMQTGHAVMATFHASTVEKLIQRMTGNPINVPKVYIDNLNVVVVCAAVRLPSGKMGRRVTSVNELIGYDNAADAFSFVEVFRWSSHEDKLEFVGNMNSYLLEERIAPRRGIAPRDKRLIYQELERRAALLKKLHESGMTNFYDLYKVLSKAQRQGLF